MFNNYGTARIYDNNCVINFWNIKCNFHHGTTRFIAGDILKHFFNHNLYILEMFLPKQIFQWESGTGLCHIPAK